MARSLRFSMVAGATYDALLGLTIVCALEPLSRVVPIPYPAEPFYARMQGILLLGLAAFYAFAAHDLERNLRIVAGAILTRTAGGLYLVGCVSWDDLHAFFAVIGAVDLAFAAWHLVLLRVERRARFWPLLLRGTT